MKIQIVKYLNGYIGINPEKTQVQLNRLYYEPDNNISVYSFTEKTLPQSYYLNEVICCSENLNLNLPFLEDWKQFEVEKDAEYYWKMQYIMALDENTKPYIIQDFIAGYNHNKKEFTEEDLRKAYYQGYKVGVYLADYKTEEEYIKFRESIRKLPTIVIESEYVDSDDFSDFEECGTYPGVEESELQPKLTTLPNGKQSVIIKELVYENSF